MKLLQKKEALHIICISLIFLLSGCSQTWQITKNVHPKENVKITFEMAQERLNGKRVSILLRDDRQINGILTEISSDSVRIRSDADTTVEVYSASHIKRIGKTDYFAGGVLGCIGGTAGGLLLAGAVAEAAAPEGGDMRGLGVAAVAAAGGTIGLLGGTIYGAVTGRDSYYEFEDTTISAAPGL